MGEVADQVSAVIGTRRRRLPQVQAEIAIWRRVDDAAVALARAVARLRDDPATPAPVAAHLGQLRIVDARPAITAVIESLQRVESRIGRGTVCIGIGGAAQAGKSTVLQSLAGLADAWLPTGEGTFGTAVVTRFLHSPGRRRASLELHTFASFRALHLQPRHIAARLGEAPADAEAFRATTYPDPDAAGLTSGQRAQLARLREMQEALWSYEGLLDRQGGVLELAGDELDGLREYLTYPTGEKPAARRYLAVREARIECSYPRAEVGAITMVDLPGIGGVPQAQRSALSDLRPEMDLALLVKRTVGPHPRWSAADAAAMAALDRARGFVSRRDDFVVVVLNTGAGIGRPGLVHNGAAGGPPPRILEADCRDPSDVSARLLRPVLQHLVRRLPAMDAEVFAGARGMTGGVREDLVGLAVAAKAVLHHVCGSAVGPDEDTYRRADELRAAAVVALRALLAKLRGRAGSDDPAFIAAVGDIHTEIVAWIRDGCGAGPERWCAAARRGLLRDGAERFTRTELGRVRMEISRRYGQLDRLLRLRLAQAWADVAAALPDALAPLLGGESGRAALARLGEAVAETAQPCPVIRSAIDELLAVRLDYRTHLDPAARSELGPVDLPVPAPTALTTPVGTDLPATLCRIIAERAERAASRAQARLLQEARLPGQVIFAAVERFSDALLSGAADWEMRQLARSYRRTLWTGAGHRLDGGDAPVARVTRAADALLAATGELVGPPR